MHFNILRCLSFGFCFGEFSKLMNAQRVENQRYKHDTRIVLTGLTVLIAMTTIATANGVDNGNGSGNSYGNGNDSENSNQNVANTLHVDSLYDAVNSKAPTATSLLASRDNRNTSDDFEQILAAQLKREEEASNINNIDYYDTMSAAVAQRKSLLSRKRRYLLFPEGSSFQLVYDKIVGIVDYTNYLILGITVAMAWQLPSKAPSEMLEDVIMQVKDGSLLLPRNDTIQNVTYVDSKGKINQKKQQYAKPNYIDFHGQKSNYGTRPKYTKYNSYNSYYTNKRPVWQPVFRPPMHGDYYYRHLNQSPKAYYHTKPGYVKYANVSPYSRTSNYGKEKYGDWRRKDDYYYNNKAVSHKPLSPFSKWLPSQSSYTLKNSTGQAKYPWWNLPNRLTNSATAVKGRQYNDISQWQSSDSGYYQSSSPTSSSSSSSSSSSQSSSTSTKHTTTPTRIPRKHRIYPVFGKRSLPDTHEQPSAAAGQHDNNQPHNHHHHNEQHQYQNVVVEQRHQNETEHEFKFEKGQNEQNRHQHQHRQRRRCGIANDELSKFDRIHIRHHRHTRHSLYDKIEKYLDKRGSHGHHCVLRALCETGQKTHEHEPGSFLGELMRALFTLPEPVDEDLQRLEYKETRYDTAHAFEGSCATRYFHCKESLWESQFIK